LKTLAGHVLGLQSKVSQEKNAAHYSTNISLDKYVQLDDDVK